MALEIKAPENIILKPKITVFGIGGAGGNAINNMIRANLKGANFVVANTDAQALQSSESENKIQLGILSTRGLGAGAAPSVGREAALESEHEIRSHLEGSNMVFITAGMGGGTGTGASPVIAEIARELGILTVGVVTKPFLFEGLKRMKIAEGGLAELQKHVDTLIVIPNQNLFRIANEHTTFQEAFEMADEVLHAGVRSVTDLITSPGLVNLDFADIETVMSEKGKAMMGTGEASGEDRAIRAAEAAIANPLLDQNSMFGACGVLINITGGKDMTLYEVDSAANRIREEVGDSEANIIFGSTFNSELQGKIRVSVVATGIEQAEINKKIDIAEKNDINILSGLNKEAATVENVYNAEFEPPSFNEYENMDNEIYNEENNVKSNFENIVKQFDMQTTGSITERGKISGGMSLGGAENSPTERAKPSLLSRLWNSIKSNDDDAQNHYKKNTNSSMPRDRSPSIQETPDLFGRDK